MTPEELDHYTQALARLAVRDGANVQPGQIVAVNTARGKEDVTLAIAEEAYRAGAKFVDLFIFDPELKRARLQNADPESLSYRPPWIEERAWALSEHHAAQISLTGPVAPHALDGIDPKLIARESSLTRPWSLEIVNARTTNWTALPAPTRDWAQLAYPHLEPEAAFERLWTEVAHVCRLDEPDPAAAWRERFAEIGRVGRTLTDLRLDAVRLQGPGTDLTIGLLPHSCWASEGMTSIDGVAHRTNLPSEEVTTAPDPMRADGHVTATKPLFTSGTTVTGLRVSFEGGRVRTIDADENADVVRGLAAIDDGAARLGELALVDRDGRIGQLGTLFYDTLLDENAATHIALGAAYAACVDDEADLPHINRSGLHLDFMVGSDEVAVSGVLAGGETVELLRDGRWQL